MRVPLILVQGAGPSTPRDPIVWTGPDGREHLTYDDRPEIMGALFYIERTRRPQTRARIDKLRRHRARPNGRPKYR